jgi:hypothetical protein
MKGFTSYVKIGLAALLTISILFASVNAQSAAGLLNQSIVTAQDTVPAIKEGAALEILNTSLKSLANQSHRNRMIGGYVLLGLGVASGIGGATVLAFAESDNARIVGYSLLGGGVLLSGLSLIPFLTTPESERIYRAFSKMPEDTPGQVRQKFYYGDRRFEELANKSRRDRFIGGGTLILSGLTGAIFTDASMEDRIATFLGPAIPGVITLLVKSDVERAYDGYKRAKRDIIGRAGGREIYFGIAPLPRGGIIGVVQVRF